MKLYLDEMISPVVAPELRRRGRDVVAVGEHGTRSKSDVQQLAVATAEQRALVTFNVGDFSRLARASASAGSGHWGIVLVSSKRLRSADFGGLIRALESLLDDNPEHDALRDRVVFLGAG